MFQVIAAAFGMADNANKGAMAQLSQDRSEDSADINYSRQKNMMLFSDTSKQNSLLLIGLLAILALVAFLIIKNK